MARSYREILSVGADVRPIESEEAPFVDMYHCDTEYTLMIDGGAD